MTNVADALARGEVALGVRSLRHLSLGSRTFYAPAIALIATISVQGREPTVRGFPWNVLKNPTVMRSLVRQHMIR